MAFTEIDEKLLVRAHQAGDERAFDTIVRTQYNALYAHALRRLSDHDSAEDAVQDTLLRAYRALPNLDGDLALRAWLHRILTNVCHDEGNRRRRQQVLVEKVGALPEETAGDPVEEAVLHDTVRIMADALKDLPETYREALVLRYVDGLSFRDVAEATGTTEENARARVHRGRLALHKVLSRVAVMLAFLIPGLRRTQDATTSSGADQAVSSGMSEHTVNLATQLTTHALTAAPNVSRFAEIASGLPGGKSTLAAAAVTAVAAVAAPVAYTVNEVRKPERPPAAVAAPAPEQQERLSVTAVPSSSSTTTSTSVAPSEANPFSENEDGAKRLLEIVPVTPRIPPVTTTTTAPLSDRVERVDAHLGGDLLTATGDSPQYDLVGDLEVEGHDKRGREQMWSAELAGRFFVYPDGTSAADDVTIELEDGSVLALRYHGTVLAAAEETGASRYQITGTYVLDGATLIGLPERGDLVATLVLEADGEASLALELSGRAPS